MVVFPNAKINLGLSIIEKRPDGLHNIESCFYPVPWYDALEIIESNEFNFIATGLDIPGEGNICIKAYKLLKSDFDIPPINVHLHKNIPVGAGLGGGSADGAFMLKLLNNKFSLGITLPQLEDYAGKLGSDCPFFIKNKAAYVEGTGNIIAPINIDLKGKFIAIIYPEIHVNTGIAYKTLTPSRSTQSLKDAIEKNHIEDWADKVSNDFEINANDTVRQLVDMLSQEADYASMTGSGSAVYGIFAAKPKLNITYPCIIDKL